MMIRLVEAAKEHVRWMGGDIIEAYPMRSVKEGKLPPVSSFKDLPAVFEKAGFRSVADPSSSKQIMRFALTGHSPGTRNPDL
jgi:hypothetical protein